MNTKETINDEDITITHYHSGTEASMTYRGVYRKRLYIDFDFDSIDDVLHVFKDYVNSVDALEIRCQEVS